MNTNINIIPFPVTCATRAQIGDVKVNLELGKVSIPVNLYGEDGSLLKTEYVELIGIEYDLWLKDDYLVAKALAKLGLTAVGSEVKAPEVQPVASTPEVTPSDVPTTDTPASDAPVPENVPEPETKIGGKKK